jgi:predicted MPP superfamily phosphohydrolase
MKCFYHTSYKFYKPKCKDGLKFFLISDIHFTPKISSEVLTAVLNQAKDQCPDYILISGDIINSLDCVNSATNLKRFVGWLSRLGEVAPTIIALGNHDFYRKNPEHKGANSRAHKWFAETPSTLVNAINDLDNVQVLDNSVYEDKNVYIFGFTQTPEYYQFDKDEEHSATIFNPGHEDKNIMLYDLHQLDFKLIQNLPKKKAKIALIHSPVFLEDQEICSYLYEFDFFISGHMHNGVVPPVISDFWRDDRGLLAPGKGLFPRRARCRITDPNQKSIILGAVSTIPSISKSFITLNKAFPVYTASLELNHNEILARKPDVKSQYISFK